MNDPADFPLWAAVLVAVLVVGGAAITLVGALGLLRLRSFYQRIHAPTLGTSLGALFVLAGSSLFFSVASGQAVLHEALIVLFVVITTPVTLMLLARAALYRDRAEGDQGVPGMEMSERESPQAGDQQPGNLPGA